MYEIGKIIVYKKDVCQVKEIKRNNLTSSDYYILTPILDNSLTIEVPVENRLGNIREIISKAAAEEIINKIPTIPIIENLNDKYIENEYKSLMATNLHEDSIRIIKTTYIRNESRKASNKKISNKDAAYLKKAENILYSELSISLIKSYDELKQYIKDICENKHNL